MAIPRSKIMEYADDYDFSFEEAEDLLFIIRVVDREHLKRLAARNE